MSVLLALLLGAALCSHVICYFSNENPREHCDNRGAVDTLQLARSNTDFAFSLYKLLVAQNPGTNIIFSPLSISMTLAFLALGAHGPTKTEILEGLKFNVSETPEPFIHRGFQLLLSLINQTVNLKMGIALFLDKPLVLKDDFLQQAWELYSAKVISTDFGSPESAKKLINNYVEQKTQGKIKDLVTYLDPEARMVLVSSLLFKDLWKTPFSPFNTIMSYFYMSKKKKVRVPMMRADYMKVLFFRDKICKCTVVQLPYKNSSTCAFLILPKRGKMSDLEFSLNLDNFNKWRDSVKIRMMSLMLPKFSISEEYNLEQILPELGISNIFSQKANLSGITTARNITVSQVIHKAILDVNEQGTEAAATKEVICIPISSRPRSRIVKFNRPFLVAIISEDAQSILYLGKVVNPKQD